MVTLRALGESVIEIGDVRIGPDAEIIFALLTYLIIERGRPVSRGELVELFWADHANAKARHCLRQAIYKLRRLGVPIETRFDRYVLPSEAAKVDFDSADRVGKRGQVLIGTQSLLILPGDFPRASQAFRFWLENVREHASARLCHHLVRQLTDARNRNNWEESATLARRCLDVDPLNEEATLTLAEVAALGGNKKRAIEIIDTYLAEIGLERTELRIPASILRNRIAERVIAPPSAHSAQGLFIGRERSLTLLQSISLDTKAGLGQVCEVYGEAGIGKSRLVLEFANRATIDGFRVVQATCRAQSQDRPFSIFMDLTPQLLKLPGALGCDPDALSLVKRLGQSRPNMALAEEHHGAPDELHMRMRAALCELIDAVTSERPLILIVDDLPWADSLSRSVLYQLALQNDRPLLLLVTSRGQHPFQELEKLDRRHVVQHKLEAMEPGESRQLAERICHSLTIAPTPSVIEWSTTSGGGNPLFITHLLAHYRDTGDIRSIPARVDALIDERLGTLSTSALRTLQTIALAGAHSSYQRIEEIIGLPRWEIVSALDELDKGGLIQRSADRVLAKHDLVASAAIGRLAPAAAHFLHHAIAASLERATQSSGVPQVLWDAAQHWEAAGESSRAAGLAARCAEHLLAIGLAHDGCDLLKRAVPFIDNPEAKLALFAQRSQMLALAGEFAEMELNARAALRYCELEGQGSHHNVHEIHLLESRSGQYDGIDQSLIRRALQCARDPAASNHHRLRMAAAGLTHCYACCHIAAAAELLESVSDIRPSDAAEQKALLQCRVIFHIDFGELVIAMAAADELVALERADAAPHALTRALRVAAFPYRYAGALETARARLMESYDVAARARLHAAQVSALTALAQLACDLGDYTSAKECITRAAAVLRAHSYVSIPQYYLVGAEAALMQGDVGHANSLLSHIDNSCPGPERHELDRIALRTHCGLLEGRQFSLADLSEFLSLHRKYRRYHGQDYSSGVLFQTLKVSGMTELANTLASEYLRVYRREGNPARNPMLGEFLQVEFTT
jgi:DNA-binding SARP family transcriptional activator/tetratricopeptide (TPR) repeat protein